MKFFLSLRSTVRSRIMTLLAASTIPLFVFGFGDAFLDYRHNREQAEQQALNTARNLALLLQRDLEARIASLRVLALSPSLQTGDLLAFRSQAEEFLRQEFPGSNILMLERSGRQVMNTALPLGLPFPARRDTNTLEQLFETGIPSVSDVFIGVVVHRPVIAIEVPVYRNGVVAYSLSLNPTLSAFEDILQRQHLGPDWIVTVIDRQWTTAARIPDNEKYSGQKVTDRLRLLLQNRSEGVADAISREGQPMVAAFTHVPEFNWIVTIGIPKLNLYEAAYHSALFTSMIGLASLLIAALASGVLAQRIIQPIYRLREVAAQIDANAGLSEPLTGLAETDEVARVLTSAAYNRKIAEHARERVNVHLRVMVDELNHRVKNMLAVVQAIIVQSLRDRYSETLDKLQERLRALAIAHDVLTQENWRGASLRTIVNSILACTAINLEQVKIDGPFILLKPRAVVGLALGLHELLTNAIQFGALSNATGVVTIQWSVSDETFTFEWREQGGPTISEQPKRGFGVQLIERGLRGYLAGGSASMLFADEGLRCTVIAPVAETIAEGNKTLPKIGEAMMFAGRLRVLVVEDETLIAMLLEDFLAELGYDTVGPATRLSQAIELAEQEVIHAALLDVNLDGQLSYPIAVRLRERGIPFAFVTGYGNASVPPDFRGTPVVTKPYRIKDIDETLSGLLSDMPR